MDISESSAVTLLEKFLNPRRGVVAEPEYRRIIAQKVRQTQHYVCFGFGSQLVAIYCIYRLLCIIGTLYTVRFTLYVLCALYTVHALHVQEVIKPL